MPSPDAPTALFTLRAASSDIRVVLYRTRDGLERNLHSRIDGIGLVGSCRTLKDPGERQQVGRSMPSSDRQAVTVAVGVRIVRKNPEFKIAHAESGAATPLKPPAEE